MSLYLSVQVIPSVTLIDIAHVSVGLAVVAMSLKDSVVSLEIPGVGAAVVVESCMAFDVS